MSRFIRCCQEFANDQSGATSIEYALIAGIVSISIAAALTGARDELSTTFKKVGTELKSNVAN